MSFTRDTVLLAYHTATVGYAGEPVVADASLEVRAGEVIGLVGPNGAGKSTLLRVVTGDADLLGGGLSIDGIDAREIGPLARAKLVGVVPQQVVAAFALPARDFVEMGRHARTPRFSALGERDRAVVDEALALTDTARLADKPTDELSGGDLQRLALAQALAQEPRVLLLDEPVSHLDLNHRLQILDLVRHLAAEKGLGVLAVFHDLDLAARYSDRIAIVADGRLGPAETPERAITAESLRTVFGVRAVVGTDPVTGSVSVTPVLREGAVATHQRGSVLVIGGSGAAAPLLRRLVLAGWQVSAGALNAGDADQIVAEALGIPYVALPPFAPMDALAAEQTAALARASDAVVVCPVPFGHGNVANLAAATTAANDGKRVLLMGDIGGRDFTGGTAEALWREAIEAGATTVAEGEAPEPELLS